MEAVTLREMATDAIRYWEPRRLAYNVILAVVVLGCAAANWSGLAGVVSLSGLLLLFVLAVLANVAYCAAYLPDLLLQLSDYRGQRRRWRRVVAAVGFTFAAVLTYFFAMGLCGAPGLP